MKQCSSETMKRGFTIIELLVTVAIFSFVVAITSGIFIFSLQGQRKTLAHQTVLDQTSYVMEYMSRQLRMARKELSDPPSCLTNVGRGYNYESITNDSIKFVNYKGDCTEFFRQWNPAEEIYQLKEKRKIGTPEEEILDLTSNDLNVATLIFNLMGEYQGVFGDNQFKLQPRATISLVVQGKGEKPESRPEIEIQTTVSQRDLDVQY